MILPVLLVCVGFLNPLVLGSAVLEPDFYLRLRQLRFERHEDNCHQLYPLRIISPSSPLSSWWPNQYITIIIVCQIPEVPPQAHSDVVCWCTHCADTPPGKKQNHGTIRQLSSNIFKYPPILTKYLISNVFKYPPILTKYLLSNIFKYPPILT